ncbi:MAG: hypothetical protein [Wendovervirus sonii]|uniref:Uncharacterized protein n=1 Tax=phage Lak_Megaphage_Sonny TaxID=3109229 RepID=A0ABZ0Z4E9_9CAUD|nr:MAG: hypothetical protein [phage Lak_Megaphage_Sonny]
MNEDRFFIPKKIRVGYQNRTSTYTGKLAYVIYIDHTGKVRKETSWQNWRDHKYNPSDFDNIPTEGFVLNKHVGGYKSDWNFRQSYCRIYDPRGFEFEITIDNLLWILDWEDCMHGKGLSGKYVYGWIYDQLYLIPCITDDYKKSFEMSDKMYESVGMTVKDLIPGASYKVKSEKHPLVFVGNLKVQNKLGKGYKSQLFFYDPVPDKYYKYRENMLIRLDKSSILCKVAEDIISKEQLDELIYRFSISAYSYDFWHTKNVIKEFIPYPPGNVTVHHSNQYSIDRNKKFGIISENGKSAVLLKQLKYTETNYSNYSYYDTKEKPYNFIEIDNEMNIMKIGDTGKAKDISYWYRRSWSYDEIYEAKGKTPYNELIFPSNSGKEMTKIYYITNDGYISGSLTDMLYDNMLSYVSDSPSVSGIVLPIKI